MTTSRMKASRLSSEANTCDIQRELCVILHCRSSGETLWSFTLWPLITGQLLSGVETQFCTPSSCPGLTATPSCFPALPALSRLLMFITFSSWPREFIPNVPCPHLEYSLTPLLSSTPSPPSLASVSCPSLFKCFHQAEQWPLQHLGSGKEQPIQQERAPNCHGIFLYGGRGASTGGRGPQLQLKLFLETLLLWGLNSEPWVWCLLPLRALVAEGLLCSSHILCPNSTPKYSGMEQEKGRSLSPGKRLDMPPTGVTNLLPTSPTSTHFWSSVPTPSPLFTFPPPFFFFLLAPEGKDTGPGGDVRVSYSLKFS